MRAGVAPASLPAVGQPPAVRADDLGSAAFRRDHGTRYAYVAGSMYKGVSSVAMVQRLGRAGLLGYFGTGGVPLDQVDQAIQDVQHTLGADGPYGMNLLSSLDHPRREERTVDLLLARGVRRVEAAAFVQVTSALVRYRLTGLRRAAGGAVVAVNRVLAKVSRPDVAEVFLRPAPKSIVDGLVADGRLTADEAALASLVPMADDICAEADSGGHTDQRPLVTLLPDLVRRRDLVTREQGYPYAVRVGVAGGLGTPEAVAASFVLGADFVLTGSINQCTVEAGTSDTAKDMLQQATVHDTTLVPAGDMLEIGAKAQVLKRGLLFPARANKLYDLYRRHSSLDEIDERTARQVQERYFRRSFDEIWAETKQYLSDADPAEIDRAEREPKRKMALVFKWYFVHSTRLAMRGADEQLVDYQIQCGPAMGALNSWLRGTPREQWRNRHVDDLAELLMTGAAALLERRLRDLVTVLDGERRL
jgi:trans-AT polyketide synthase/acyltransferase/oxidoreductase domain-containing protein